MPLQILINTPIWVFAVLIALVLLGAYQLRPRTMPRRRVVIFPLVFLVLSLQGVVATFGWGTGPLLTWLVAYCLGAYGLARLTSTVSCDFDALTQRFTIAGSKLPLILLMSFFAIKYLVGASTAMGAEFIHQASFPILVSMAYGLASGGFAGRSWRFWQLGLSKKSTH